LNGGFAVQPHGEEFHVEAGQQVLHWWGYIVNSECRPAEAHDSIDRLIAENVSDGLSQTELLGGEAEAGERNYINAQGTVARARAVLDGEELAIVREGGGFGGIEAVFLEARLRITLARLVGALVRINNPQVGATSVGDNGEGLWWCS